MRLTITQWPDGPTRTYDTADAEELKRIIEADASTRIFSEAQTPAEAGFDDEDDDVLL